MCANDEIQSFPFPSVIKDVKDVCGSTHSSAKIVGEGREKVVLWFGFGTPLVCSVCGGQLTRTAIYRYNLIHLVLCLLTYRDNNLSQLFIWFSSLFLTLRAGFQLFTYLILDFYSLLNTLCLEKQGTFTREQLFCVSRSSIHLALETTGDCRSHVVVDA